jgi:phosphopantothenoylcysteine synthetase/decarboxylase
MKRIIVDYKKLTPEILKLLVEKYPDGYDDLSIISFKNAQGEIVECVEVRTEDTIYLVKVSTKLARTMENFEEDDFEDSFVDETDEVETPDELPLEDEDDGMD